MDPNNYYDTPESYQCNDLLDVVSLLRTSVTGNDKDKQQIIDDFEKLIDECRYENKAPDTAKFQKFWELSVSVRISRGATWCLYTTHADCSVFDRKCAGVPLEWKHWDFLPDEASDEPKTPSTWYEGVGGGWELFCDPWLLGVVLILICAKGLSVANADSIDTCDSFDSVYCWIGNESDYYTVIEDIVCDGGWWSTDDQVDSSYLGAVTSKNEYFADIKVETNDVVLDLNGHGLENSDSLYDIYQQEWFSAVRQGFGNFAYYYGNYSKDIKIAEETVESFEIHSSQPTTTSKISTELEFEVNCSTKGKKLSQHVENFVSKGGEQCSIFFKELGELAF